MYSVVFGAGIWLLLRLCGRPPQSHEAGPPEGEPIRSAGITPAPAVEPDVITSPAPAGE